MRSVVASLGVTAIFLAPMLFVTAPRPVAAQEIQGRYLHAQAVAPRGRIDPEAMLGAVVQVRMRALPGARSSETLGPTREGSGVVIDERGHVLTIGYIVTEADTIDLVTVNNRVVPAVVAAYDHATGFGLLRAATPLEVVPMALGNSDALALQETVMVLPAGGRDAASIAAVMSKRSFTGSWEYLLESALFTSPPTMQWAGAALVNREGKLVGIGSLLVRDTVDPGTPRPGNMFVPIDLIKPILADMIANGRRAGPIQPWLGIATDELQGRLFVTRVSPDGPADKAGIRRGDIVMAVGAEAVNSQAEFYRRLWSAGPAGSEVRLRLLQGADMRELRVRSIDRIEYFKEKPTL